MSNPRLEKTVATHPLFFVFPLLMLYAASMDVLTMRIANAISLALVAVFIVMAIGAGMAPGELAVHLAIGAAVLVANMLLFYLRLVGGGDAKLLAAAAVWVGYEQLMPFVVYVTVFGGALALVLLAFRRMPAAALPLPSWAIRLHNPSEGMPYGVAIAAGALAVYPTTTVPMLLAG